MRVALGGSASEGSIGGMAGGNMRVKMRRCIACALLLSPPTQALQMALEVLEKKTLNSELAITPCKP